MPGVRHTSHTVEGQANLPVTRLVKAKEGSCGRTSPARSECGIILGVRPETDLTTSAVEVGRVSDIP